jgi:hypothetical protein
VPTLILHRTGDRMVPVEHARYLAKHIPGANYVELPGTDSVRRERGELNLVSALACVRRASDVDLDHHRSTTKGLAAHSLEGD